MPDYTLRMEDLPSIYSHWRQRYEDRDTRIEIIHNVVRGDWQVIDQDEEELTNRSPNMIQVALEDTSEAGGTLPTLRVQAHADAPRAKKTAASMEKIGIGYLEASKWDLLVPQTIMQMAATGFAAWTITPDVDERRPRIALRESATCYPEPGFKPGDTVQRCMFVRQLYLSQLPMYHQEMLYDAIATAHTNVLKTPGSEDHDVTLVEWYDEHEYVLAGLIATQRPALLADSVTYIPVELERIQHKAQGVCPVVIGSRFSLDGEFRGQFDQVVEPLLAHSRLLSTLMDYSDQAVYSDIWVKDLIGAMPWGGGGFIRLGPNGAIGRVPPAVSSLDVQRDLQALEDSIHMGGRWPKSRPGEVDQSIVSAKGIEAMAGVMNTALRTYHTLLKDMFERAVRIAMVIDRKNFPGKKSCHGILRNQEYMLEYDPRTDIDLRNQIRFEYGLGLGRTASETAVLLIQYRTNELLSTESTMESIDGIKDVAKERARMNGEKVEGMMFARLLQLSEGGALPPDALVEIHRRLIEGTPVDDLYEKYVVEPQQAQMGAAPAMPPGMAPVGPDGGPLPPEMAGGAPQGAPGQVPTPPDGAGLLARLGVPAGPNGKLGSEVMQRGG